MTDTELVQNFKKEIEKSLLLEENDQKYFLENAEKLPLIFVQHFYDFIKEKNDMVDRYINRAVEKDPSILTDMKTKVRKLRKHILELKENAEQPQDIENSLEEELKNL